MFVLSPLECFALVQPRGPPDRRESPANPSVPSGDQTIHNKNAFSVNGIRTVRDKTSQNVSETRKRLSATIGVFPVGYGSFGSNRVPTIHISNRGERAMTRTTRNLFGLELNLNVMAVLTVLVGIGTCTNALMADVMVTFQQGALIPAEAGGNGVDTYSGAADMTLRYSGGGDAHYNTGGELTFHTGRWQDDSNDINRMLVDFDGYGTLGTYLQTHNLEIESATLKLYMDSITNPLANPGTTLDVYKAVTAFNEGIGIHPVYAGAGQPALSGESCWLYQAYNTTGWAGGGSYSASDFSTELDTGVSLGPATVGTWVSFDVTGAYANGATDLTDANPGVALLDRNNDPVNPYYNAGTGTGQMLFTSRNAGSNQPVLQFTLVPEPGMLALLATGLLGLLCYAWRKRK